MATFAIHHLYRLTSPKILGSPPLGMLAEASFNVRGNSGIERVVGTEDDVDMPENGCVARGAGGRGFLHTRVGFGYRHGTIFHDSDAVSYTMVACL